MVCARHRILRGRIVISRPAKLERTVTLMTTALTSLRASDRADDERILQFISGLGDERSTRPAREADDRHVVAAAVVSRAEALVRSGNSFRPQHRGLR